MGSASWRMQRHVYADRKGEQERKGVGAGKGAELETIDMRTCVQRWGKQPSLALSGSMFSPTHGLLPLVALPIVMLLAYVRSSLVKCTFVIPADADCVGG